MNTMWWLFWGLLTMTVVVFVFRAPIEAWAKKHAMKMSGSPVSAIVKFVDDRISQVGADMKKHVSDSLKAHTGAILQEMESRLKAPPPAPAEVPVPAVEPIPVTVTVSPTDAIQAKRDEYRKLLDEVQSKLAALDSAEQAIKEALK